MFYPKSKFVDYSLLKSSNALARAFNKKHSSGWSVARDVTVDVIVNKHKNSLNQFNL